MTSEETDSQKSDLNKAIYRFLGGLGLGVLLILVPISYGASIKLNFVQAAFASILVISGGFLSVFWSKNFINAVMRLLEECGL